MRPIKADRFLYVSLLLAALIVTAAVVGVVVRVVRW